MKLFRHLRIRLAVLFTGGFGILLLLGAVALHEWLAEGYRADFDRTLTASGEALRDLFQQELRWFPEPREAAVHVVGELLFPDRVFLAFEGGELVAASRGPDGLPRTAAFRPPPDAGSPARVVVGPETYRVLAVPLAEGLDGYVALPEKPLEDRMARLRWSLLLGLPLILVVGGVLGAAGARFALRPVVEVAGSAHRVAEEVAGGRSTFHRLPPAETPDEIGVVTEAFNTLVARLEAALGKERELVEHQRAFLAAAAHELRMPVTILRTEAEVALEGRHGAEDYRVALGRVVEESEHLATLVSDLLLLARADATEPRLSAAPLYLDDLVGSVLARVRSHPDARDRVLRVGRFEPAPAFADPVLTERGLGVLVHNALVHGGGSDVEVDTGIDEDETGSMWAWVEVRDHGPGIPPGEEDRIFDRFVRLDPDSSGSGLGLPIARWIAEVQGGDVVGRNRPEGGAAFRLRLPRAGVGAEAVGEPA